MAQVLPFRFKKASGEIRTRLDGQELRFFFAWNVRHEFWSMSLYLSDGTPLFQGIRLTTGIIINRQIVNPDSLQGRIVAVDTTGNRHPPGRYDLYSGKVQILYYSPAEVEERLAAAQGAPA